MTFNLAINKKEPTVLCSNELFTTSKGDRKFIPSRCHWAINAPIHAMVWTKESGLEVNYGNGQTLHTQMTFEEADGIIKSWLDFVCPEKGSIVRSAIAGYIPAPDGRANTWVPAYKEPNDEDTDGRE